MMPQRNWKAFAQMVLVTAVLSAPSLPWPAMADDTGLALEPLGIHARVRSVTVAAATEQRLEITAVAKGSPADGLLKVGDAIVGLSDASYKAFPVDARQTMIAAVVGAEARSGCLPLVVRPAMATNGADVKVVVPIPRVTDRECGPSPFAIEQGLSKKAYYDIMSQIEKNPIITHLYTADPSPQIWSDTNRVWLYCSHDNKPGGYEAMDGYHVFSSTDLALWKDHGEALHSRDVSWAAGGTMWAPDCMYRDGTYYFYFPTVSKTAGRVIGVATSNVPEGPFIDIGRHIEGTKWIDPCCFIDDDGAAYLYFGEKQVARLKANMIELAEKPRTIDCGEDPTIPGFEKVVRGSLHNESGSLHFKEASCMIKKDGIYYLSWNANNNKGVYAMGKSPYGPFTYGGILQTKPPGAQDHHGMVQFRGQWYYFYHVGNYIGGDSRHRNICIDKLTFNPDGTIQPIVRTKLGVMAPGP